MIQLEKTLKQKEYFNIYLFVGNQDYLKDFYVNKLKEIFIKQSDDINFSVFDSEVFDFKSFSNAAMALPFFADYKLLYLKGNKIFDKLNEPLSAIYNDIPKTTIILINDNDIDSRKKLYKTVKKNGLVCEFNDLDNQNLIKWIVKKFREDDYEIGLKEAEVLLYRLDSDMYGLLNEINKIKSYMGDEKKTSIKDLDKIISPKIKDKVFEMINCISNKNEKDSLKYYNDLISLDEPPMKILSLLIRNYNILISIKDVNINNSEIIRKINVPSFFAKRYKELCSKYTNESLKEILDELYEIDYNIKTGNINDRYGLELFIVKHSRK